MRLEGDKMLTFLAMLGGFITRYLPAAAGKIFDFFTERANLAQQIKLEEVKAKSAEKMQVISADLEFGLAQIQERLADVQAALEDRKSARQYGMTLISLMEKTLRIGRDLGVTKWTLGFWWGAAMAVEVFSAAVQPMIAATVFSCWLALKVALFFKCADISALWTLEDWLLLDAVMGFYLAGRLQKRQEGRVTA